MASPLNHYSAVQTFVGLAIKNNLLDTLKQLYATFDKDITLSVHEVMIETYGLVRSENADMMKFLFDKGLELESSVFHIATDESPLPMFKVIFEKHKGYFEKRQKEGKSITIKSIKKKRLDVADFLLEQGFTAESSHYPLKEFLGDFQYDSASAEYVLKNIAYTKTDLDALDDDWTHRFCSGIARKKDTSIFEAINKSDLRGILSNPLLVELGYKERNANLLQFLDGINIDVKITLNEKIEAANFVRSPSAFETALLNDPNCSSVDFGAQRIVSSIFKQDSVECLLIAAKSMPILSLPHSSYTGKVNMLIAAFSYIKSNEMLDAFFDLLPNDLFFGNDLLSIVLSQTNEDTSTKYIEFIEKASQKGAIIDVNLFYSVASNAFSRPNIRHFNSDKWVTIISDILSYRKDLFGDAVFKHAYEHSLFCGKSFKQMLAGFRQSYSSSNDNTKASQGYILFSCAPESIRVQILEEFGNNNPLDKDVAFATALDIWGYDPISVLLLPVNDKIKARVIDAMAQ